MNPVIKHRLIAATLGTLSLLVLSTRAHAMVIDFDPVVGTITGTDFVVTPFELTTNTDVRVTLTDLESPVAFTQLAFGWFTESDGEPVLGAFLDGPGILDFNLDPGNYLAVVGGIAGGDLNIGTFGLEISNVPLPPAIWLMFTSLAGLGILGRRRTNPAPH